MWKSLWHSSPSQCKFSTTIINRVYKQVSHGRYISQSPTECLSRVFQRHLAKHAIEAGDRSLISGMKRLTKVYKCEEADCSKEFHYKEGLDGHLIVDHGKENLKWNCKICSASYIHKRHHDRHMREKHLLDKHGNPIKPKVGFPRAPRKIFKFFYGQGTHGVKKHFQNFYCYGTHGAQENFSKFLYLGFSRA